MNFLMKGILLGFSIAAPVGPIGVLCIRRTLQYGRSSGFISGLGAALADAFYGAIALFGISAITDFFLDAKPLFKFGGGIFLILLGLKIYFSKAKTEQGEIAKKSLFADFLSTFVLNVTNPLTVLGFIGIFAALGICEEQLSYFSAGAAVWGIFLGSTFWWFLLSGGVSLFRKKMNPLLFTWLNRITAGLIAFFGILTFFL